MPPTLHQTLLASKSTARPANLTSGDYLSEARPPFRGGGFYAVALPLAVLAMTKDIGLAYGLIAVFLIGVDLHAATHTFAILAGKVVNINAQTFPTRARGCNMP